MRTKTFDSIVELLHDREWHVASELAEKTRYPDQWIETLWRESVLEIADRDGQRLVRLRTDVVSGHVAVSL
jgi:hypothetical protein